MTVQIVRASIHPGIGIARIGNSDEFFLAPEVMTPKPKPQGFYHDDSGALKREAAGFRIYGYDADGTVVDELTLENAEIEWTVHLASAKAQWFIFTAAMDLPEAVDFSLRLRNPDYDPSKRIDLRIDPGPLRLAGPDNAAECRGVFRYEDTATDVMLGELRTDDKGRLRVLSGKGESGAPTGLPLNSGGVPDWFANATGWYDDIADGPVMAKVVIGGREIPCDHGWVVTAPPNYAPDIIGWRTIDDLLQDLYAEAGWIDLPDEVSFTRDIYPLLGRLTGLQWVNKGLASLYGAGGPLDFGDPDLIDRIGRVHNPPHDTYRQLRRTFANRFRKVGQLALQAWPAIFGDTFGTITKPPVPGNFLPIWNTAEARLARWVEGDFIDDWGTVPVFDMLAKVDLADRPRMLDRAAMHFCLADAFHPGCEITWPIRHLSMHQGPYRIKMRDPVIPEPDYGTHLTQTAALSSTGPLNAQGPGGLTRWMALPWQMDTAGCRSDYDLHNDPYLPTFWPARVPNNVLTRENYDKVMDTSLSVEDRRTAFQARRNWYFPLGAPNGAVEMERMVERFGEMGVVERRPGPTDGALPELPEWIYVETLPHSAADLARLVSDHARTAGLAPVSPADRRAQEAGWIDEAHRQFYLRARFPTLADDG